MEKEGKSQDKSRWYVCCKKFSTQEAVALSQLHARTLLDVSPALTALYEQISEEKPDAKKQKARLAAFDAIAAAAFTEKYREEEKEHDGYHRPAYTAFRFLSDQCEAGRAAALMTTDDPEEVRSWLAQVEDWQALPIEALEHALAVGVAFPLEEKPLNSEVMSGLAVRLTRGNNIARQIVLGLSENAEYPNLQSLFWMQSLMMAALKSFDWTLGKTDAPVSEFFCPKKKEEDERHECTAEEGLVLIRRFAQIEAVMLPLLYAPQMLTEENAAMLPSLHRWGLYCTRALDALDAGRPQEYLTLLRRGVKACPGEKDMVQFLLDRFMEDAAPKTSPELLALAEKVRTILAAYDPADPGVAALKASPAYQQVAWIIEEAPGLQRS